MYDWRWPARFPVPRLVMMLHVLRAERVSGGAGMPASSSNSLVFYFTNDDTIFGREDHSPAKGAAGLLWAAS